MNSYQIISITLTFLSLTSFTSCDRHHHRRYDPKEQTIIQEIQHFDGPVYYSCNETLCPYDKGVCALNNECFCYNGYLTTNSKKQCRYRQKSLVLYLLLEFIASFGIGHFYVGNYIYGAIKFALDVCIFIIYCFCHALNKSEEAKRKEAMIRLGLMILFLTWQVIDAIFIGMGYFKDGNNMPLEEL